MLVESIRRRDVLNPWFVFRSAITGKYVSRAHALLHPHTTLKEKRW
jgi:hypothetical protein